jgi:large subunit ribosomal protein L32e
MTDKARLLKIKATLKKRQPKFIRQDAHKHKRVKQVWRAPKGLHSKMRDSRRGYKVKLQGGYQTPKDVRGLDKHGLKPTLVATQKELAALDPKVHSVILKGTLGGRKKVALLEEADKKKFTVLNAKADAAQKLKSKFSAQSAEKKKRESERTAKHKSLEEKAATKKDGEEKEAQPQKRPDEFEHKKKKSEQE